MQEPASEEYVSHVRSFSTSSRGNIDRYLTYDVTKLLHKPIRIFRLFYPIQAYHREALGNPSMHVSLYHAYCPSVML